MTGFSPECFFDLKEFAFSSIFEKELEVWQALNKIKDFLSKMSLGKIEGDLEEGVVLVNSNLISIGKGTVVESGAYIVGPCVVGKKCQIRQGAYIRGQLIAGDNCVIGHATEVKNAIFFDHAKAGHFAYVGDSILGNRVNLGAGTKCANLRFDGKNINIMFGGSKINSGLRKFGAILGDDAQTGCNSVTNPGTILGRGAIVGPCCVVGGVVPQSCITKAAKNVTIRPRSAREDQ